MTFPIFSIIIPKTGNPMPISIVAALLALFCILSLMAFGMAVMAWIEVKAMQKSTHSIQYVPASSEFEKISQEFKDKVAMDDLMGVV